MLKLHSKASQWEEVDGCALRKVTDEEGGDTPYLHVSWSRKIKRDADLETIFAPYSPVKISRHKRSVAYITFASATDATKAKNELHASEWGCIGGRRLFVVFAMSNADFRQPAAVLADPALAAAAVSGLVLLLEFVTPEEEAEMITALDSPPCFWRTDIKTRRVQHFGYEFDYNTRSCHASQPLAWTEPEPSCTVDIEYTKPTIWPSFLLPTLQRVASYIGDQENDAKHSGSNSRADAMERLQLTVNEYAPGQVGNLYI